MANRENLKDRFRREVENKWKEGRRYKSNRKDPIETRSG
jgi:hypothetical protein